MSQNNKDKKDPIVGFSGVKRSTNEQGKLRVELTLTDERAVQLIEELTKLLGSDRGKAGKNTIKLDVHVREKEHEGRKFDSAFAFVKAVQDFGANGPQKTFKAPEAKAFDVADKIAKLKGKVVSTAASSG